MRCPDMFGWMVFVAWRHREPGRAVSALDPRPDILILDPILSTPAIANPTGSGRGSMPLTSIFLGAVDAVKPCDRRADAIKPPDEGKKT